MRDELLHGDRESRLEVDELGPIGHDGDARHLLVESAYNRSTSRGDAMLESTFPRYRYVTPRSLLGYLNRLGQPHGWKSVVERGLILLIVAGVVIGLLILTSGNHANVFCNIPGSPGQ